MTPVHVRRRRAMTRPGALAAGAALALALALAPTGLTAQSIVAGSVVGTVTDVDGLPLRGVAVGLEDTDTGLGRETVTGAGGSFSFTFVPAGEYLIRVEALGYRPRVVTGVVLGSGGTLRVSVQVVPEPPPVTRIDTVSLGEVGAGWSGLGLALGSADVDRVPEARLGLGSLVALSSEADDMGGFQGRPASRTVLFSEGEPFRAVRHPAGLGGDLLGLPFPRPGLTGLEVRQGIEDIEWLGSDGAVVPLRTRLGAGERGGSLYALGAGGGMWSSELVDETPSLLSFWGGGDVALSVVPDTTVLSLAVEGGRIQTVQPPSVSDTILAGLLGDGTLDTGLRELMAFSGQARMDWALNNGGQVTARAGVSRFERTLERGQGPGIGYGIFGPATGTDGSVAAVVSTPLTGTFHLEFRGSVGFSSREYEPDASVPGAFLVSSRARVGPDPAAPGTISRVDVGGGPVIHYQTGTHRLKAGLRMDFTSHDYTYVDGSGGLFSYGLPSNLAAGRGYYSGSLSPLSATDFASSNIGLFGQYTWAAAPGVDITTGLRWSRETLPLDDVRRATEWQTLTGLANDSVPGDLSHLDGRFHLLWDLQQNGRTFISAGLSLQHGRMEPDALAEWLTLDGGVRFQRRFGTVTTWPQRPDGPSAPVVGTRLSILGPDLEPPRSVRGAASLVRELTPGVRMGIAGSYRRTESLLRRRDLNRVVVPTGVDQNDRPVYGTLGLQGGVVAADPATDRRFEGFDVVWARDADGWSEYRGVSVFLDATFSGGGRLGARYTYSETTDNLVGAAAGRASAALDPDLGVDQWDEGISDFDVPHRGSVLATLPIPRGGLTAVYRFSSGTPFTAMVAGGLDVNGDGSLFNDPAFVPVGAELDAVAAEWNCVAAGSGTFAVRNACRGDAAHRIDLRLDLEVGRVGGVPVQLMVDALNLTDQATGVRDDALLVVDPAGSVTQAGGVYTVPYRVNPSFGTWLQRTDPGRLLRVGVRIGGER